MSPCRSSVFFVAHKIFPFSNGRQGRHVLHEVSAWVEDHLTKTKRRRGATINAVKIRREEKGKADLDECLSLTFARNTEVNSEFFEDELKSWEGVPPLLLVIAVVRWPEASICHYTKMIENERKKEGREGENIKSHGVKYLVIPMCELETHLEKAPNLTKHSVTSF